MASVPIIMEGFSCAGATNKCNHNLGLMCSPPLTSEAGTTGARLCLTQRNCQALAARPERFVYAP